MRLQQPEAAATETAERLLSPVGHPCDAGERLEAARGADQKWREQRTERARRSLSQVDRFYQPLFRAMHVMHVLLFLHTCGRCFGFNGAIRQAIDGTSWEICAWIYHAAILAYLMGLMPITVCVLLYRAWLVRWVKRQGIEFEEGTRSAS